MFRKINPEARSEKEPQFVKPSIQRFEITELPPFKSANPAEDTFPRFPIK